MKLSLIYFLGYYLYASVVGVLILIYIAKHTPEAKKPEIEEENWIK